MGAEASDRRPMPTPSTPNPSASFSPPLGRPEHSTFGAEPAGPLVSHLEPVREYV